MCLQLKWYLKTVTNKNESASFLSHSLSFPGGPLEATQTNAVNRKVLIKF